MPESDILCVWPGGSLQTLTGKLSAKFSPRPRTNSIASDVSSVLDRLIINADRCAHSGAVGDLVRRSN